ncbi:AB hydrolase superfamily protein YdjP [Variovorax sp. PBL-H6]|uniref:alpha/beta fold hydrolase n=1 Tax=Variovorax sp. PBL-H6 TaxID=434009 RepID=UPI0013167C2C|nr:alpha/beta hydrolase [Variovorax sp. PBL-H6]VTU24288.1 AB hydrolase superfamily protein YdjP [Variovorax sp. PBL-H6]
MLDRAPPDPPSHPPRLTGLRGTLTALRNFGLVNLGSPAAGEFDSFTASDGQIVPVYVLGKGPPMVLVHGVGCSHSDWMPVARRLARRHCVLAWDARGHGHCRPVRGSITLARLAADLAEMLDHFGLQRAVLVGHSMGALTLMQYLHLHGTQRVAAVALVDQSPRIVTDDSWRLGLFGGCSAAMLSGLIAGARQDLAEALLNEVGALGGAWLRRQLGVETSLGRMLRRRLGSIDIRPLLDLAESMAQADFRASLSRLDAPLLVVLGARSPHYAGLPLDAWYRETVKHAQISVYPRAGHSPHVSEPLRFARELERFLEDHA